MAPTANTVIEVADGRLVSRLGPQPPVPLYAETDTRFFARVVDAQVEFELDGEGNGVALVLHQGGRETRAPRVEERVEISVSREILARYVGTYELSAGFLLAITLEDGRLMLQGTGQGKAELYAEAEKAFFLKVADAQVEFVAGDDGEIEALILHQGGENLRAPRL